MQLETRLYRLLSLLDDAEIGHRGYLLTNDARYLAPYLAALPAIDVELKALTGLTSDNPVQQKAFSMLRQQTTERIDLLKRGIEFRRVGDEPQALDLMRSGAGKELMDRMRETLARMVVEEDRLLEIRLHAQDGITSSSWWASCSPSSWLLPLAPLRSGMHIAKSNA